MWALIEVVRAREENENSSIKQRGMSLIRQRRKFTLALLRDFCEGKKLENDSEIF